MTSIAALCTVFTKKKKIQADGAEYECVWHSQCVKGHMESKLGYASHDRQMVQGFGAYSNDNMNIRNISV